VPENTVTAFSSVFLDKNPPVDARIDEMLQWGKKIYGSGGGPAMAGNLSFRTKMGFIITGSGLAPGNATKDTVVEVRGVVFGLNRPSVYAKGQVAPAEEALLHSVIYEALPEINAIFFLTSNNMIEAAGKFGSPAAQTASPAGSRETAQEIVNLIKVNNNAGSLVINNCAVIISGKTMSDAGQLAAEIQSKTESGVKSGARKK
jgi:ribulose-5-phosphate 4-epimerase/fuculose-1-phosphate aldolase